MMRSLINNTEACGEGQLKSAAEVFCAARIKDPARRVEKAEPQAEQLREEYKWLRAGRGEGSGRTEREVYRLW